MKEVLPQHRLGKYKIIWLIVFIAATVLVAMRTADYVYKQNQILLHTKTMLRKTKDELDTATKILEKTSGNTLRPEIVNWAYKNAARYIPKINIVQILSEASKYENYLLILSVIREESAFDPFARSTKGAKGLGQIRTKIPETGKSVWLDELIDNGIFDEEVDVYDYRKNIAATNYILNKYKQKYGSWKTALYHYVNGNSSYVTKVLADFAELTLIMEGTRGQDGECEQEATKEQKKQDEPMQYDGNSLNQ